MSLRIGLPAAIGIALTAVYLGLQLLLRWTQHRSEPPVIETTLPFITPAIGLSKHTYFADLKKRYKNLPIYTLRLPGQKIYVINDPRLISALQRQYKIISFQAVEDGFANTLLSLTTESAELQKKASDAWRNGPAHMPSPGHEQFKVMAPGKDLDQMNQIMLKSLDKTLADLVDREPQKDVHLFEWIKDAIMIPTTDGIYGHANPYRQASARKDYWTWFNRVPLMSKGLGWLAKDGVAAIQSLGHRFERILEQSNAQDFHGITRHQLEYFSKRGNSPRDIALITAGSSIAVLGNTIPTAFWYLVYLYSDRKVFEACRQEVVAQVRNDTDERGNRLRTLDITALKSACPLLQSAFKEVLRLKSIGPGVRKVSEDHLLDGKYLLRKDALVFMPLSSQHYDHDRWGADAEEYCFDRFTDKTRPRMNNVSFRAFGGGTSLCPGRHFVTTELLAFAAMMLLRFEVIPKNGEWVFPSTLKADMTTTMPAPDVDINVRICRRDDDKGIKWAWKLSESENVVMLEDQDEDGNAKSGE